MIILSSTVAQMEAKKEEKLAWECGNLIVFLNSLSDSQVREESLYETYFKCMEFYKIW